MIPGTKIDAGRIGATNQRFDTQAGTRLTIHASRALVLFLAGLVAIPAGPAQYGQDDKTVALPKGELRHTTVDDIRPNLDVKHEMWSYRFVLDDGIQLFIDFRRADLGTFKGKVLGADFAVVGFKGEEYDVSREYPADNLKFDETTERLSVHPNIWFEGKLPSTHRLYYATRKKGTSYFADLTFSAVAPGSVWGDGIFRFGKDEFMGMTIPIPYARVNGRIAINADTIRVSGTGYMDHVFQSDKISSLVDAGYRIMSHDRGWEVGLFLQPTRKFEAEVIGYGVFNMGAGRALYKPVEMSIVEIGAVDGDDVPSRIILADGEGRQRVVQRSLNRQKLSLLREVGGLKKFIAKKIAGGDVLMFRGVGTLDGNRPMAYDFFVVD